MVKQRRHRVTLFPILAAFCCLSMSPVLVCAQSDPEAATTGLGGEMLLFQEIPSVYGASKYEQKLTDAPSFVSIVTASEIKMYGYRTLADILRSVPGFFSTYDRNYSYVGVRGFGRPGDYNTRVQLLVDGHRINDSVYDQAPIGTDFPVDIDLIDRVEVIRGPSSSIYGANAFFAVINIMTKRGRDLKGFEVSGEGGSFDTYKGRLSYGTKFQNGVEMLVSGSYFNSLGQNLHFKEFDRPATNHGIAHLLDGDQFHDVFSKFSFQDFSVEGAYHSRDKGIPTASFDTIFNDPREKTVDERAYMNMKYQHNFDNGWGVTARAFYDHYNFNGGYPYSPTYSADPISSILNKELSLGESIGTELQVTKRLFEKHKFVFGTEYRNNFIQNVKTYDEDPFYIYTDQKRNSAQWGVYLQDEFSIFNNLILNMGVRHDEYETFGGTTNPRLALIYHPFEKTVIKALYGQAFRPPNIYELYFEDGTSIKANPSLIPERITTYELVWEQYLGSRWRITAAGFYNDISNLISLENDPTDSMLVYRNVGDVIVKGFELQLEGRFPRGIEGRISYAFQVTEDQATGKTLTNSPEHQAKLNVIVPLIPERLFLGTEFQYISSRKTLAGAETDDAFVTNITFFARNLLKDLDLSASVYNLFDQKLGDPGSTEHRQDIILQDGINFRVKVTYSF
jgi:outer membrane receptor for ferrienterochelin and colicins